MDSQDDKETARAVLVHLSDLHFRVGDEGREERNAFLREKLVDDLPGVIAATRTRTAAAVLVTGDIAFSGKKEQFDLARIWLTQVCLLVGAHPTRILCVPGNHDVDRDRIGATHRAHRASIAECGPFELDHLLDEYLAEADQPILTPLAAYSDFAAGSDCHFTSRLHWDISLPVGDRYALAFRGATSVINSGPGDDAAGSLAIQKNQLLMRARPGQINVFLAHHDPYFWSRHMVIPRPADAGASLALYGHTHTPHVSKTNECIELTAGAVQPDEGADWNPTYNVVEVEIADEGPEVAVVRVEVWRRRFSSEVGHFVGDAHGAESISFTVQIPVAAAMTTSTGDTLASGDGQHEEATEETGEERAAMSTPDGDPVPLREAMLALSNIGAGTRLRIIAELGLLDDTLAALPQRQQIPAAAQAIIKAGKTEEFETILARLDVGR